MATPSTAPIHPASLIDPSLHSSALLEILEIKMSSVLIRHVVDVVVAIVDNVLCRPSSSVASVLQSLTFRTFVTKVLSKAQAFVDAPTVLVALIYVRRAKTHMIIKSEKWANERVFLGAVILANKYLNDRPLTNVAWASLTRIFTTQDISLIEREFLDVLAFELSIKEADFLGLL